MACLVCGRPLLPADPLDSDPAVVDALVEIAKIKDSPTKPSGNTGVVLISDLPEPAHPPTDGPTVQRVKASSHDEYALSELVFEFGIDFPQCANCIEKALRKAEEQLASSQYELESYRALAAKLEDAQISAAVASASEMTTASASLDRHRPLGQTAFEEEVAKLEREEADLKKRLSQAQNERKDLEKQRRHLTIRQEELHAHSMSYFDALADLHLDIDNYGRESESVSGRLEAILADLDSLRATNPLNDTFHIWYDGHFGTINSLRLGRLPAVHVEWMEINAALGQACLLLDRLANACGYQFTHYVLKPMGSFSRIVPVSGNQQGWELYGTGEVALQRLFSDRRFDSAMVGFATCINELASFAHTISDGRYTMPYPIEGEKINSRSVKLLFNQWDAWTLAMKSLLTDLKWLMSIDWEVWMKPKSVKEREKAAAAAAREAGPLVVESEI